MDRDMFITLLANYTLYRLLFYLKYSAGDASHKGYFEAVNPSSFYLALFITLTF